MHPSNKISLLGSAQGVHIGTLSTRSLKALRLAWPSILGKGIKVDAAVAEGRHLHRQVGVLCATIAQLQFSGVQRGPAR